MHHSELCDSMLQKQAVEKYGFAHCQLKLNYLTILSLELNWLKSVPVLITLTVNGLFATKLQTISTAEETYCTWCSLQLFVSQFLYVFVASSIVYLWNYFLFYYWQETLVKFVYIYFLLSSGTYRLLTLFYNWLSFRGNMRTMQSTSHLKDMVSITCFKCLLLLLITLRPHHLQNFIDLMHKSG